MALQDTITNLGTAIINLVTSKITKHSSEIEEALLELQAKIDELLGGGEGPSGGEEPGLAQTSFNINGYTGTVSTSTEDDMYVTIYEFNPVLNMDNKWFKGTYDNKPDKLLLVKENDEVIEYKYREVLGSMYGGYMDTGFQITGSIKQVKLYSTTIQKINISSFSAGPMPPV